MPRRKVRIKDQDQHNPERVRIDEKGKEVLDVTPVTLPVRFLRGENIADRVKALVDGELTRRAAHAGYETVDDADDFDVGDDYDPQSPHEVDEDAEAEYFRRRDEHNTRRAATDRGWFKGKENPPPKPSGGTPENVQPKRTDNPQSPNGDKPD